MLVLSSPVDLCNANIVKERLHSTSNVFKCTFCWSHRFSIYGDACTFISSGLACVSKVHTWTSRKKKVPLGMFEIASTFGWSHVYGIAMFCANQRKNAFIECNFYKCQRTSSSRRIYAQPLSARGVSLRLICKCSKLNQMILLASRRP